MLLRRSCSVPWSEKECPTGPEDASCSTVVYGKMSHARYKSPPFEPFILYIFSSTTEQGCLLFRLVNGSCSYPALQPPPPPMKTSLLKHICPLPCATQMQPLFHYSTRNMRAAYAGQHLPKELVQVALDRIGRLVHIRTLLVEQPRIVEDEPAQGQ